MATTPTYIDISDPKGKDGKYTGIQFPSGEPHVRIEGLYKTSDVHLRYCSSYPDIMRIAMAVDVCRQAQVNSITLHLPFVPFARQDRRAVQSDSLSIAVFAKILNSLNFDEVIIVDPHSDVTPALIERVRVVKQAAGAFKALRSLRERYDTNDIAVVAPDLGSAKKAKELADYARKQKFDSLELVQCDKTRDPVSGQITGFKILSGSVANKTCLMVDDICDGGGTFMGLAEVLAYAGATRQGLYVTHGLYTKGLNDLGKYFTDLYTTNSVPQKVTVGLTVFDIGELYA